MQTILLAGGTGLIGSQIIQELSSDIYHVKVLTRNKKKSHDNVSYYEWDIKKSWIEDGALKGVDHIINLTGAGIADKRWTNERKKILIESRTQAAVTIKENLIKIGLRPRSYVSASAIGYYGDSGDQWMKEKDNPVDSGFLSECCVAWENAAKSLEPLVERCCIVRVGIVLSQEGGAFEKMLLPFKFGSASYFGNGLMWYSWIHIEDIARIFVHMTQDSNAQGIFNGVAPEVVTNKFMIETIKEEKGGFSILHPVPSLALRVAMGEMADVVLTSNRVSAEKLIKQGFNYQFPALNDAVKDLLN